MIKNAAKIKAKQLGMPIGTASNQLRKNILFSLVCKLELNRCFQCGELIESTKDFSIEHKIPWLNSDNPIELFFSLDNIAFSHIDCNVASRRFTPHGNYKMYVEHNCRCVVCKQFAKKNGLVLEMADKSDSNSDVEIHEGSTPS